MKKGAPAMKRGGDGSSKTTTRLSATVDVATASTVAGASQPGSDAATLYRDAYLASQQHILHQDHALYRATHALVATAPTAAAASANPNGVNTSQQQPSLFLNDKRELLLYLDYVKSSFRNQQKFNGFLDLMKEFELDYHNVPEVIARISSYLRGYPELIIGFNMLLPYGYKMEVQPGRQVYVNMPCQTTVENTPAGATLPDHTLLDILAEVAAATPPIPVDATDTSTAHPVA